MIACKISGAYREDPDFPAAPCEYQWQEVEIDSAPGVYEIVDKWGQHVLIEVAHNGAVTFVHEEDDFCCVMPARTTVAPKDRSINDKEYNLSSRFGSSDGMSFRREIRYGIGS